MVDSINNVSHIQSISPNKKTEKNISVSVPTTHTKGTEFVDSGIGRDLVTGSKHIPDIGKITPRRLQAYGYEYGRFNIMSKIDYSNNIYKGAQFKEKTPESFIVSELGYAKNQVTTQRIDNKWICCIHKEDTTSTVSFDDISENTARVLTDLIFDNYNIESQDKDRIVLSKPEEKNVVIGKNTGEILYN